MSNYRGKKSSNNKEFDEVEELLRATEDAMTLNLSVDAHHTSRSSNCYSSFTSSSASPLDDDLVRRFEALKKPTVTDKITTVPPKSGENKKDGGDAFARFSALRGGGSSSVEELNVNVVEEEEDEVEKLMKWAVDAARLDPSLSGDEVEEDGDDEECSSSDLDDDEEEEEDVKKKQQQQQSKKKKKDKPVK